MPLCKWLFNWPTSGKKSLFAVNAFQMMLDMDIKGAYHEKLTFSVLQGFNKTGTKTEYINIKQYETNNVLLTI